MVEVVEEKVSESTLMMQILEFPELGVSRLPGLLALARTPPVVLLTVYKII